MSTPVRKLVDIIKNYRRVHGVTQTDFTKMAGFSNTKKLSELELHRNENISIADFYGIAHALDRSPGTLAVEIGIPYAKVEQEDPGLYSLFRAIQGTLENLGEDERNYLCASIRCTLDEYRKLKTKVQDA